MKNWFARLMAGAGSMKVVGPRPQVIGPRPSEVIAAPPRFAWDEKRWQHRQVGERVELSGRYRVFDRERQHWLEFDGLISQEGSSIAAYIANPPVELKAHPHGACLQLVNDPWFRLHWSRQPSNLDEALLHFEAMLDESFNRRR